MSSRNRKRKRVATTEVELVESTSAKGEAKTSEDEDETIRETQVSRPSRNRRKSAKLTEAEEHVKAPDAEPQRLSVISLHHEKGGRKDSGDSWTITSSTKPKKKSAVSSDEQGEEGEEKSQLLHVVSKGKRQQTIKIKPLHKPEPAKDEKAPIEKPTLSSSRHAKKSHQRLPPPITIKEETNVSESGIKLKLILSPKDKGKTASEAEAEETAKDRRSASREKAGKPSSREKEEQRKAKLVIRDEVLELDGDKVAKKRKRGEVEPDQLLDTPDSSKANKRRKTTPAEKQKAPTTTRKPTQASKSVTQNDAKALPSDKISGKGKTPDRSGQRKSESKSRTKTKAPDEANCQSSDTSKDENKSKKKKSKVSKTPGNFFNLLSTDEPIEDLVIDELKMDTPKKAKSDKPKTDGKKKSSELDSSHKSKKHKSKDIKKHRAKFINTGTKKPGRSVGLDPVTASHMFGQFDSLPAHPSASLDLKGPSAGLDDESFFMAGSDATVPPLSAESDLLGLSGLGFLGSFGKMKKTGKKSGKRGDKDKKKKKKKDKLRKDGKFKAKEKKPLSAYMLWCGQTRRKVVAQNPDLDFSGISKMMGTLWQQLPEKEKMVWYSKQRQQNVKHKNVPSLSKQKLRRSSSSGRGPRSPRGSPVRHFASRTEPIDSAAHLKLLGESLALVGDRLQNHVGHVEVHGSLSVLLDSTLCALAPLMSLTCQVPELNSISKKTIGSTLDNIAYIMPGLG